MERTNKPGFARMFYVSNEWHKCRSAYLKYQPLCERCGMPAQHVHHKQRITPQNIKDPAITLAFDNLEALCEECHRQEHKPLKRWRTDEMGHVDLG